MSWRKKMNLRSLWVIQVIYDINFRETFLLIRKNKVLDPIFNSLPEIPEVLSIKKTVEDYVNNSLD